MNFEINLIFSNQPAFSIWPKGHDKALKAYGLCLKRALPYEV